MDATLQRGNHRRDMAGFTILELMIVVTIIGILASLAIPSFNDMIQNNRRTTVVNELLSNMMLARAEAAKTGRNVVVCGVRDSNGNQALDTAEQTCNQGNDWRYGWMVATWVDANGDGVLDSGEMTVPPLRVFLNPYSDIKVTASGLSLATTADRPATGVVALRPFNTSSSVGLLTVCDKRGASKARAVLLNATGRAASSETDANGGALTCP